ncbi:PCRF domain-containing protein, partial [Candidatus Gottesmanbacteria bacterium]|nr:PCRF domain-containing protein [Candidatus Gottesmanbacteria bacterium]
MVYLAIMEQAMEELRKRTQELIEKLDLEKKEKRIKELELQSSHPSFWQNPQEAGKKMQELAELQKEIDQVEELQSLIAENKEREARELLEKLEFNLFLSDPHDASDAILSIHAGQGGVEAMDWTEMLLRMYTRYAEDRG